MSNARLTCIHPKNIKQKILNCPTMAETCSSHTVQEIKNSSAQTVWTQHLLLCSHCCHTFVFSSTKWISPYLFIHMTPLMNTVNTSPAFADWDALLPFKVHTAVWFTHSLTIPPPLHLNLREAFWKCSNIADRTSGTMTYIGMPRRRAENPSHATMVCNATNSR